MPQVTSKALIKDLDHKPFAKHSSTDYLHDISQRYYSHAHRQNKIATQKKNMKNSSDDSVQRSFLYVHGKHSEMLKKRTNDLNAYGFVLQKDFCAEKFKLLNLPKSQSLEELSPMQQATKGDPKIRERINREKKILQAGFDMRFFRPDMEQAITRGSNTEVAKRDRKRLAEKCRERSFFLQESIREKTKFMTGELATAAPTPRQSARIRGRTMPVGVLAPALREYSAKGITIM